MLRCTRRSLTPLQPGTGLSVRTRLDPRTSNELHTSCSERSDRCNAYCGCKGRCPQIRGLWICIRRQKNTHGASQKDISTAPGSVPTLEGCDIRTTLVLRGKNTSWRVVAARVADLRRSEEPPSR